MVTCGIESWVDLELFIAVAGLIVSKSFFGFRLGPYRTDSGRGSWDAASIGRF